MKSNSICGPHAPTSAVDSTTSKFTHRCNVSPLRGKKPQNRPLVTDVIMAYALRAAANFK